jgi:hypothetical protein
MNGTDLIDQGDANVQTTSIKAVVFYRHDPNEVAGLSAAMIPMADHLKAVYTGGDKAMIKRILEGQYFRFREAKKMRTLLQRASRHARANLAEYFPMLRESIMEGAERLEVATEIYWSELTHMVDQVLPTQ